MTLTANKIDVNTSSLRCHVGGASVSVWYNNLTLLLSVNAKKDHNDKLTEIYW